MKLFAILNVVAWMGFWSFGYIALTSSSQLSSGQISIAAALAALGFAVGMVSYLRISNWSTPRNTIQKEEG